MPARQGGGRLVARAPAAVVALGATRSRRRWPRRWSCCGFRGAVRPRSGLRLRDLVGRRVRGVGGTGLHTRIGEAAFEIGYWIRESRVGEGLSTEACAALTRVASRLCGIDRIEIRVDPGNERCLAIPRKLGFVEEGTLRGVLHAPDGTRCGTTASCSRSSQGELERSPRPGVDSRARRGRAYRGVSRSACVCCSSAASRASICATRRPESVCAGRTRGFASCRSRGSPTGRGAVGYVVRSGATLALVPEPENEHDPNAVGIWNEERTLQAGYVPRDVAPELQGDEQAVSLWRVEGGLRVLIVPHDAWVGRPR